MQFGAVFTVSFTALSSSFRLTKALADFNLSARFLSDCLVSPSSDSTKLIKSK